MPASYTARRSTACRRESLLARLFAGLLVPLTLACAPAAPAHDVTGPVTGAIGRPPAVGSGWGLEQQPELVAFNTWAVGYAKARLAGAAPDAATLAEGTRLAESRRAVLGTLMQTDPARALAAGVPQAVRDQLPASVLDRLETPFASMGDVSVDAGSGQGKITVDGRTYTARLYSEQMKMASQAGASLRGFALDGAAVLDTSAQRVMPAIKSQTTGQGPRPQVLYGNDPFAGAYPFFGNSDSVQDNNFGATKEPGEPNHANDAGGASVWYVWTPPNSGNVTFTTDDGFNGTAVDTLLAVYTGNNVAALTSIAYDDDYNGGLNSQVTFYAEAGVTYYIAVDGYRYSNGPSEGNFILSFIQEGNPLGPTITSGTAAGYQLNTPFTYAITATNNPTSYSATGLPDGLSLDPTTGIISGSLSSVGYYVFIVSATNAQGTGSARVVLTVGNQPTHFPFFSSELALPQSPGFYYLHLVNGNIFGYYTYLDNVNFIYHIDLGFEYTYNAVDGFSGIYFYDFTSGDFFYTSPTFPFPYLYDFKLQTVLYYFPDPINPARYNTNGVRYFYNFATGQIISM